MMIMAAIKALGDANVFPKLLGKRADIEKGDKLG
jgi:hypothetical protein